MNDEGGEKVKVIKIGLTTSAVTTDSRFAN